MNDANQMQVTDTVAEGDPAGLLLMDVEATRPLGKASKERFANNIALGMNVQRAWEAAGYAPHASNCYKMLKEPKVAKRVEWLKRKAAERTIVSKETVTGRLIEYADTAAGLGTAAGLNVARQATMDAAQINGLVINRSETKKLDELDGLAPNERSYLTAAIKKLTDARTRREMARNPANRTSRANAQEIGQDRSRE